MAVRSTVAPVARSGCLWRGALRSPLHIHNLTGKPSMPSTGEFNMKESDDPNEAILEMERLLGNISKSLETIAGSLKDIADMIAMAAQSTDE